MKFEASTFIESGELVLKLNNEIVLRNTGKVLLEIDKGQQYKVSWIAKCQPGTSYSITISSPPLAEFYLVKVLGSSLEHNSYQFGIKQTKINMKNYKIKLVEAVDLINNFISAFEDVAKNEALGGTIKVSGVDGRKLAKLRNAIYTGNMGWFCYNTSSNSVYPKLFLSFEESNEYTPGQVLQRPDNNELICPSKNSIFTYPGGNVKDFLKTHETKLTDPIDQIIDIDNLIDFKEQFLKHPKLNGRNDHPYGFFEKEDHVEVSEFLSQTGIEYVRYYFGFHPGKEENEIRIILVGVDKNGKNLLPSTENEVVPGESSIIQNSWPPQ